MQDDKLTLNYVVFGLLAVGVIFGYARLFPKPAGKPAGAPEPQAVVHTQRDESGLKKPAAAAQTGAFWESTTGGKTIKIETPLYTASLDTAGGVIRKWVLKNYSESPDKGSPLLNLVDNASTAPEPVLGFEGKKIPPVIPFKYDGKTAVRVEGLAKEIVLSYEKNGLKVLKRLSFSPDTYLIAGRYEIQNKSSGTAEYAVHFLQRGEIEEVKYGPTDALVVSMGGEKKQFNGPDDVGRALSGKVDWLGFSRKYFILAALPESGEKTEVHVAKRGGQEVETRFSYGRFSIPSGSNAVRKWKSYIGPKQEKMLRTAGDGLENSIDYGWFGTLSKIAVEALRYTNRAFNNYGISIIVITVVFRLLFLPVSIRGMRSMKKMQKKMEAIKPKLDAIKEKFKDDKKRQNEETMKIYSSHGINPLSSLGGCLPMLAQVPVFIALYYGLLYSIELRHSPFLWINDLSAPESLFNIPATSVPFRILPLAMGVSWWFSTKLTPMTATGDTAAMQAKIMQFMPVVFTFVMWDFPSGLVMYWTSSNILSVAQQIYINRSSA